VLLLAVAGALVVLAATLGLVVQAAGTRAHAQAAADLAAVSAARAAQRAAFGAPGGREPCDVAAGVADHNGTALAACDESAGGIVAVAVTVETPAGGARATARAGPRS
jgi:secretion/DNA translocation related TadE-like protein